MRTERDRDDAQHVSTRGAALGVTLVLGLTAAQDAFAGVVGVAGRSVGSGNGAAWAAPTAQSRPGHHRLSSSRSQQEPIATFGVSGCGTSSDNARYYNGSAGTTRPVHEHDPAVFAVADRGPAVLTIKFTDLVILVVARPTRATSSSWSSCSRHWKQPFLPLITDLGPSHRERLRGDQNDQMLEFHADGGLAGELGDPSALQLRFQVADTAGGTLVHTPRSTFRRKLAPSPSPPQACSCSADWAASA